MRRKIKIMKHLPQIVHNLIPDNTNLPDTPIHGLTMNSNNVNEGDIFIAVPGINADGHDFIHQAIDLGASAIISNGRDVGKLPVPQIKVADPRRAASIVASEFYGHPSKHLTVIGITGTNGKTTTASILKSILNQDGQKVAQIGTLGVIADGLDHLDTLTTPDPITLHKLFLELNDEGFSHVVMEVSSHALDQYRVADVEFNIAVFTNLAPEHLDYHGTMESYYKAKLRLFTMLAIDATAVVNISDDFGKRILKKSSAPVIAFSNSDQNSIYYQSKKISITGITGKIIAGHDSYSIKSKLTGDFNCENILAAVSVAHALGQSKIDIEKGIQNCSLVPGRMEIYGIASGANVIVDYAHTPDSYEKVLYTLKKILPGSSNMYVVFGAGGDRDAKKRPEMAKIAEKFANHCFITPDNPRTEDPENISNQIATGFKGNSFTIFTDRGKGLRAAIERADNEDIIVVLGKGREEYQEIKGKKVFYSDIQIIKEYK